MAFSAGSAFVTLGARFLSEGWDRFERSNVQALRWTEKGHHVPLTGEFLPKGFEAFIRANQQAGGATEKFAAVARGSMGQVDKSMQGTAMAAERYMAAVRQQLGYTAREYETVAAAAQHSATRQESAMAQAAAASTKHAGTIRKSQKEVSKGFNTLADVGKWGAIGGAVGAGVSMKWATDFQKNMILLRTEAGYTNDQVKTLSKQVLDLAPAVGIGPNKLAEGLYHIASAGIPAAKAMETLKVAAQGARIGNADMQDVTRQLASVIEAQKGISLDKLPDTKRIHGVTEAMGVLIRIVGHGNLRMKDLIAAMGSGFLPTALNVGLSLRDVGSALDVMTARGIPAEQAANRMRTTLQLIASPSHKAEQALATIGLTHDSVAKAFRGPNGLVGGLELVHRQLEKTFPTGRKLLPDEYKTAIADYNKQLDAMGAHGRSRDEDMKRFKDRLKEVGTAAIQQNTVLVDAFGGARMGSTMITLMQHIDDVKKRMQGIGTDSKSAVDEFHSAVDDYQKTAAFQFQQFWALVQKLGIELGDKLLPAMISFLHSIEDVVHWLDKHKDAAAALAKVIEGVLLVAVTTFFIRLGAKLTEGAASIGRFVFNLDKVPGSLSRWAKSLGDTTVANEKGMAATDKLTEAIALQGEVAANTAKELGLLASTGEAVTAGGVVIPHGFKGSKGRQAGAANLGFEEEIAASRAGRVGILTPAEEEALVAESGAPVGAGRLKGLRSGAGKFMGRAGKGLGVSMMGYFAADILGTAIGGKGGRGVKDIGGDAAIGAGLGMMLGPEGAIAGGVIGGLVGAFHSFLGGHDAEDYGKKIAKQAQDGMGTLKLHVDPNISKSTQEAISKAGTDVKKLQDELNPKPGDTAIHARGRTGIRTDPGTPVDTAAVRRQMAEDYLKIGEAAAQAFNSGLKNGPHFQTAGTLFSSFRTQLDALPAQARGVAGKSMLEMAAQLEKDGRTPRGAVQALVRNLAESYGVLPGVAAKEGKEAMRLLTEAMQQDKVVSNAQTMIDNVGKAFADAPKMAKVNAKNVRTSWQQEMDFLATHFHDKNKDMRDTAHSMWQQIHDEASKYSKLMRKDADSELNKMVNSYGKGFSAIGAQAWSAFDSVTGAASAIAKNVNTLSTELGIKGITFKPAKHAAGQQSQMHDFGNINTGAADYSFGPGLITHGTTANDSASPNFNMGGIPNPGGGAADDHILVDPSGRPVAALSGTEGILNTPQMGIVDQSLALASALGVHQYGGLGDLWGSGMRHYAAGGVLQRANQLDQMHLPYVWGGHHGERGPIVNPRPGLDCSSAVSYVLGIPPRVSGAFSDFGSPGTGAVTIYYNPDHTFMKIGSRYFGTSGFGHPKAGGGPAWFTRTPTDSYLHGFETRHVGLDFGGGLGINLPGLIDGPIGGLTNIARAAMRADTRGANNYILRQAGGLDGSGQALKDGSAPAGTPSQARAWTRQAMQLAGVSGLPWQNMLLTQEEHESTFNPLAQNNTDVNARMGNPSRGIMQITGTNFAAFHLPHHSNILNPVDNIAAAIKYIIAVKGHGNALAGLNWMIRNHGKAYAGGGRLMRGLPGFQGGGHLAHAASTRKSVYAPTRRPTKAVPFARPPSGRQILPHNLGKLAKFANLPGIGPVDDADQAIQDYDSTYTRDETYFSLVDQALTPSDLTTLIGLRSQAQGMLAGEGPDLQSADTSLGLMSTDLHGRETKVRRQATGTLARINRLKLKMRTEGRRLARLRHTKTEHMMNEAELLAKKIHTNMTQRARLADRETAIRSNFRRRIRALMDSKPVDNTSPAIRAIHARYRPLIARAHTTHQAAALEARRDSEVDSVRQGHRSRMNAHTHALNALRDAEQVALEPIIADRRHLTKDSNDLRYIYGQRRRKYQHQGWDKIWSYKVRQYHLQDLLDAARAKEKALSGGTTEVGKGGLLGDIIKQEKTVDAALTGVHGKEEALPGQLEDAALSGLTLWQQRAQAEADQGNRYVELVDADASAGPPLGADGQPVLDAAGHPVTTWGTDVLPPEIVGPLRAAGLLAQGFRRVFAPAATDSTAAAAAGGISPADITAAVQRELAGMDAASQALYSQFGSNSVNSAGLGAALSGGAFSPGARFFGAAGAAINAGLGLNASGGSDSTPPAQQVFNQTNHYTVGPVDPHLHAQASAMEFSTAFG